MNRTRIVRLHGTWNRRPVLTWQDAIDVYQLPETTVASFLESLKAVAGPNGAPGHHHVIESVFSRLSCANNAAESPVLKVLGNWYQNATFLLVGVSQFDPFFQVLNWMATSEEYQRNIPHKHIFVANQSMPDTGRFKNLEPAEFENWDSLAPFFEKIAVTFFMAKGGKGKERRARVDNYKEERLHYGDQDKKDISGSPAVSWLHADANSLIPFAEIWKNVNEIEPGSAIEISIAEKSHFSLEAGAAEVRQKYWDYRNELRLKENPREPQKNEIKIRVNSAVEGEGGAIRLDVEPVEYKDFLATNHFVANMDDESLNAIRKDDPDLASRIETTYRPERSDEGFQPRAFLCGTADSVRLAPHCPCSNHLGASSILLANYRTSDDHIVPVLLCPPSGDQISSPGEIIPTVSGSLDWPMQSDAKSESDALPMNDKDLTANPKQYINVNDQMKREFFEECIHGSREIGWPPDREALQQEAIEFVDCLILRNIVLSFCQNLQRGGKPEFFFLTSLKMSANYFATRLFRPNWELKNNWWEHTLDEILTFNSQPSRRKTEFYPSPLTPEFELAERWEDAFDFLFRIILDNGFNPVLRAHLFVIVRYCADKFPEAKTLFDLKLAAGSHV